MGTIKFSGTPTPCRPAGVIPSMTSSICGPCPSAISLDLTAILHAQLLLRKPASRAYCRQYTGTLRRGVGEWWIVGHGTLVGAALNLAYHRVRARQTAEGRCTWHQPRAFAPKASATGRYPPPTILQERTSAARVGRTNVALLRPGGSPAFAGADSLG